MRGYTIAVKILVGVNADSDIAAIDQIGTVYKEIDKVLENYKKERPISISELVIVELLGKEIS